MYDMLLSVSWHSLVEAEPVGSGEGFVNNAWIFSVPFFLQ